MIEQHFEADNVFKWTLPKPIGKKVDFKKQIPVYETPKPAGGFMTKVGEYNPQNGKWISTLRQTIVSYEWLAYTPYFTTKLSPSTGKDVLTGPMSGCIIPVWKENKVRYVGHVGTTEIKKDSAKVKQYFADYMSKDAKGFNPAEVWKNAHTTAKKYKYAQASVVALVTTKNQCFALLMLKLKTDNNYWVCGGKKPVNQMNFNVLYEKLVTRTHSYEDSKRVFQKNGDEPVEPRKKDYPYTKEGPRTHNFKKTQKKIQRKLKKLYKK